MLLLITLLACSVETPTDTAVDTAVDTADYIEDRDAGVDAGYLSRSKASCKSSPSKTNCDGKDPDSTGCSADADSYGTKTFTVGGATVTYDLRYSETCKSNWTRITATSGASYLKPYLRWGPPDSEYAEISATHSDTTAGGYYWTSMRYCPTGSCVAQACAKAKVGGSTSSKKCQTTWY